MSETRIRHRPLDPCSPAHLAVLLSNRLGREVSCDVSPTETVIYDALSPAEVFLAHDAVDAYVFDPDFQTDPHVKLIRQQHAVLTAGLANWDSLTLGQKDAVLKSLLRQSIENFYISEAKT